MKSFDATLQSEQLNEELDIIVYGNVGVPLVVFPTFDFSAGSWETGGMVDRLSELIDAGKIQLFCTDSVDGESWYARNSALDYRSERQEAYFSYVIDVLVPYIARHSTSSTKPVAVGCGIGATNATIAVLRRPELFGGLLALSGIFDARFFSAGATNDLWLANSPLDLTYQLDDKQLELLKHLPLALLCGQGRGEDAVDTMRAFESRFHDLAIDATFEYWGYDVTHDWSWWQEMVSQLLPELIRPAGLAHRRYLAVKSSYEAELQNLKEAEKQAEQSKLKESRAKKRLDKETENISQKSELAQEAAKAANAAWKKRNAVAARLAALDKEAGALQAAADAAAKAHADAKWFAGEARSEYEDAHLAFIDATEHTKSVRSSVQAIEKKCKDLETAVHAAESTAEAHHKAVRKRTGI